MAHLPEIPDSFSARGPAATQRFRITRLGSGQWMLGWTHYYDDELHLREQRCTPISESEAIDWFRWRETDHAATP